MSSSVRMNQFILKLISVCEVRPTERSLIEERFDRVLVTDDFSKKYYQDNFFTEFREFMYPTPQKEEQTFAFYERELSELAYIHDGCTFSLSKAELVYTPSQLGIFSVTVTTDVSDLNQMTMLLSSLRSFDRKIETVNPPQAETEAEELTLSRVIEEEVLGFNFRRNSIADLYSGSKFKMFLVGEHSDLGGDHELKNLLYDVATCSAVGSAAGEGYNAPHPDYLETLQPHYLSAFKNYEGLVLLDSFVVMGQGVLIGPDGQLNRGKELTWDVTYFRIYVYLLFLKYSLYRFNNLWKEGGDQSDYDHFEEFYYRYNISHVSFNFLPQLVHDKIREGIEVDQELLLFKERMKRLNELESELQSKKNSRFLKIASIAIMIASVPWSDLYDFFTKVHVSPTIAFSVIFLLMLLGVVGVHLYNRWNER